MTYALETWVWQKAKDEKICALINYLRRALGLRGDGKSNKSVFRCGTNESKRCRAQQDRMGEIKFMEVVWTCGEDADSEFMKGLCEIHTEGFKVAVKPSVRLIDMD